MKDTKHSAHIVQVHSLLHFVDLLENCVYTETNLIYEIVIILNLDIYAAANATLISIYIVHRVQYFLSF